MINIPQEIKEFLHYDPFSGGLFWIKSPANASPVGSMAGSLSQKGYINVIFKKKSYKAHRLIWFLYFNEQPNGVIDHVNGNKDDNRIVNLRLVTEKMNQQNRPSHRKGRLNGTYFHKASGRWAVRINHNGKVVSLKTHNSEEEAHNAYLKYAIENKIPLIKEDVWRPCMPIDVLSQ